MGVCVVENLSRVFLSEIVSFTFMGNEGIYSMGGVRRSLLKILQVECFATTSREGLTRKTLAKTIG